MQTTNEPTPKDAIDAPITEADTAAFIKEHFAISDERAANWHLAKLAGIRSEQARVTAQAKRRAEELDADYARLFYLHGGQLEEFARAEATARRRKTITLLQGTLTLRAVPARLTISDVDAATETARAVCPDALVTETITRLDRAALMQAARAEMETMGAIVPGFELTAASESFAVNFPGEKDGRDAE